MAAILDILAFLDLAVRLNFVGWTFNIEMFIFKILVLCPFPPPPTVIVMIQQGSYTAIMNSVTMNTMFS